MILVVRIDGLVNHDQMANMGKHGRKAGDYVNMW